MLRKFGGKMSAAKTYRELSVELDEVLARLQDPELDVDEAVHAYEAGLQLVEQLEKHLQRAENKIQAIQAKFGGSTAAEQ
jgi:exodeoxyribonuclease VII small subunit